MNKKKNFYLLYTLLFMGLAGLLVYFYYSQGKALIDYKGDGFRQHYRAVLYTSDLLKGILSDIFIDHRFTVPQWDFSLGEGYDILQTFHYYGISDPLLSLSVFVPDRFVYLFYDFVALFRMYLSGLAFAGLCFYTGRKDIVSLLCGSLVYSFCGYPLVAATGHTFFLSAMIWLPMIIKGVEKIINDDSPAYLSVSVCLSALSNVYFFYMNVLATVIYVIVRLLTIKEERKKKLQAFLKIAVFSVVGLLLSAIVSFPMAYALLSNARLASGFDTALFEDLSYYKTLFTTFAYAEPGYYGGYSIAAVFSLILLLRRKGNLLLKILLGLGTIFICLPLAGKVFNAMMYSTNRWAYCLALLVAYIVVRMTEDLDKVRTWDLVILTVYPVICILLDSRNAKIYLLLLVFTAILAVTLLLKKKLLRLSVLLVVMLSISFSIIYNFSPIWWNFTRTGTELETVYEMTYPDTEILNTINEDSFFRYSGDSLETNSSVNNGYHAGQFYWSISNSDVIEARKELGLLDHNNHHYDNYNDRFLLNALSSTKYYIEQSDNDSHPYGFTKVNETGDAKLFQSSHSLPLLYAYPQTISTEEWLKLDLVQRNEALSQAAVIENGQTPDLTFHGKDIPYEMSSEDVEFNGKEVTVLNSSSYIDLKAQNPEAGEYYLVIEGFDSEKSTNWVIHNLENKETVMFFKDDDHTGNADKHDFLINLGYYDGFDGTVRIALWYPGVYSYRNMRLVCQPLEKQIEDLKELNSVDIRSLDIDGNLIKAEFSTDKDVLLCMSVPYAKGWKAYLDGKEVDIIKTNLQYMGIETTKGTHTLEMRYSTPLLKEGFMISLASAVFLLIYRLRRKH